MEDRDILNTFIPIVDFLGEVYGSNCEVALYDLTENKNEICAISNSSLTGRRVGDPLTKTLNKLIEEEQYKYKDFITRFPSKTKDGKISRTSVLFIKNKEGRLIGLLTLSFNLDGLINSANFLNKFLSELTGGPERNLAEEKGPISEDFSTPIEDYVMSIIQKTIDEINISPERMSTDEKIEIVQKLNNKGVFLLKGAVTEVAKKLKISEPTIYRYIKKD
ncbi:MAG: YheO domain protein [Caloramator sp.]|jgi:predicted transcriptional regulator YheO|uniref:helix-turn-helix transcriptional regulator n=1 Tax=Caloramator sp. TaxID=1871330 RepID=UPI001D1B562E|nr:PAS domain-containing protein [Caloramator sp.]MBZ4663576.1 YheO domain protein [Caloramator sp.]